MAFEIRIKPLVLFDLEDKIKLYEHETDGDGRRFYHNFLEGLSALQRSADIDSSEVYETVKKYVSADARCSLFYTVAGNLVMVIGLL